MLRRIFVILATVFAIVALALIALWAVLRIPIDRQLDGGLHAFDTIGAWRDWFLGWATALLILLAIFRRARAIYLAALVAIIAASLYAPYFFVTFTRLDRVRGEYEQHMTRGRAVAVAVVLTLVLALLYAAMTKRYAPLVILCALLPPLWFLPLVQPATEGWYPIDWDRPDLLIAYRPCRGAVLVRPGASYAVVMHIDDIWDRFDDPRGGVTRAISGPGRSTYGYFWLTEEEAKTLAMRKDDPNVIDCDSRARPERVRPAAWHRLGLSAD